MTASVPAFPLRRQRGNTLTGIIIGLIVGLGIAVVVALTITKGATPFTDKPAKAGSRPTDAGPGRRSEQADVRQPATPRARRTRKSTREGSGAQHGAGRRRQRRPTPAPAPAAPAEPTARPGRSPIKTDAGRRGAEAGRAGQRAAPAARRAAAAPAAAGCRRGDGEYIYYLQAGAFRDMPDAEATRAKLALLGFEAAISDRTTDSGVLHRVRLGPYNQVEAMNKARAKLLDNGVDVAIVRNQR